MLASTLIAIFVIPVCFKWFERKKGGEIAGPKDSGVEVPG
jgi:hypothetical protein